VKMSCDGQAYIAILPCIAHRKGMHSNAVCTVMDSTYTIINRRSSKVDGRTK
jgi:hypothetical protein